MTLREIPIDKCVRYFCRDSHSHSEQTPPISKERKKKASNTILRQKIKNFI